MAENTKAKEKKVKAWEKEERRKKGLRKLKSHKKRKIMAEEIAAPSSPPIVEPATKIPSVKLATEASTIVEQKENEKMMAGTANTPEPNKVVKMAGKVSAPEPVFQGETQLESSSDDCLILSKVVEDVRGSPLKQNSPRILRLTESATQGENKGEEENEDIEEIPNP